MREFSEYVYYKIVTSENRKCDTYREAHHFFNHRLFEKIYLFEFNALITIGYNKNINDVLK